MDITIAIGTDHRGFVLKELIVQAYKNPHYAIRWIDRGAYSNDRTDYPLFAHDVARLMESGESELGILICGTGIGMAIAANRHKGVRAGVAWNGDIARLGREDDHMNVLCIPADYCTYEETKLLIDAWLKAQPKTGRYAERVALLDT